jgi:hypothetical protein
MLRIDEDDLREAGVIALDHLMPGCPGIVRPIQAHVSPDDECTVTTGDAQ